MKYVSTRGQSAELGFCDALIAGLADDGGLFLPARWPHLSREKIASLAGKPYADVAFAIIQPFVDGEIEDVVLRDMIRQACAAFRHPAVAPLVQFSPDRFVLELFHGPTLAFKDVAMQLLARLVDHVLAARGQRATIVGATSGDTGSAAIEAFRGRTNTDIFILHPAGKVSDVQRRQMTTVLDSNVHNIALEGSFDDCQAIVKSLFMNAPFKQEVRLSGVNSINWGRIVAQIVYYFTSAIALGAPHRPVSFTVPTGNFGDIFAAYAALKMGLPIERLVIATNENDILHRVLETGRYQTGSVTPTTSPSMDIQVSSNFERLLFEALDRDADAVRSLQNGLTQSGGYRLPPAAHRFISRHFSAGRADQDQTAATIRDVWQKAGYLLDPHSAVAMAVAERFSQPQVPMIVLATAHPAKFPDAVEKAAGIRPALPEWLADLHTRTERCDQLENDQGMVQDYIRRHLAPQGERS